MVPSIIYTTVHSAIIDNQPYEVIEDLLNKGIDLNTPNDIGNTALHLALDKDRADIVNLLLRYKADVNIQNDQGDTSLHWAIYCDAHDDIITNLLNSGASPYIRNNDGASPLDLAYNSYDIPLIALINDYLDAT